jgi:DNA-binding protein YbaB
MSDFSPEYVKQLQAELLDSKVYIEALNIRVNAEVALSQATYSALQNAEKDIESLKRERAMLVETGEAIIEDLVIRAKLEEDDSLNVSDSILQAFEQALSATEQH